MEPFRVKKILFPVDFSTLCDGAARFVEAFAGRLQAELTLLHVIDPKAWIVFSPPEYYGAETMQELWISRRAEAQKRLDSYLREELKHFEVQRLLVDGDPASAIAGHAHETNTDLIMMPSRGMGAFRRYVLGSVTAKVLHDAECPVWTGAHLENAPVLEKISFESVICAVDLGLQSEKTLRWAAGFAQEHSSRLTIVHAVPDLSVLRGEYVDTDFAASLAQNARDQIAGLLDKMRVRAEFVVGRGDPDRVVSRAAEEQGAKLVVIARGLASAGIGRLRTHAYAIIRNSPCPVVSV
jgi:nucleotide-binding universal stress UspA family protein